MKSNWKIPKPLDNEFKKFLKTENQPVVTRFPPEPSGYLHIGHVKALMINKILATKYNGMCIIRMDDTNPNNESQEYVDAILEDIKTLQITIDKLSYTSDYFQDIIKCGDILIDKHLAYVDDTHPEIITQERHKKVESINRHNSIEKNSELWNKMKNGEITNSIVRIKIDMANENGALRDPTIFRSIDTLHYRTADKFKVYPTYDFACPVVDSLEKVTHVFRSVEFSDRDEQYQIILKYLNMPTPILNSYGKVTIQDSVLSKRKIKELLDTSKLAGWDDPRLLTVRGVLRAGLIVPALMNFIEECGFTKASVNMTPTKLWGINRKHVDKIATRYVAIPADKLKKITVIKENDGDYQKEVDRFKGNKNLGQRPVYYSDNILVSTDEFVVNIGDKVTLINWGNMLFVNSYLKELQDTNYTNTIKLLWLQNTDQVKNTPLLIKKYNSLLEDCILYKYLGEPDMINIKKGDIIQLYKLNNYYICDSNNTTEVVLIEIPT